MVIQYPVTRTVDQTDTYHGVEIADPYRWLEDDNSEETMAWVAEQNAVAEQYLNGIPQRETVRQRLRELFATTRSSIPRHINGRRFVSRSSGLQNQPILYVEEIATGESRVLIDPNTMSDDGTVAMVDVAVSHDARLVAIAFSTAGSDWQEIRVYDVATGDPLGDVINRVKFSSIHWTHDNLGFFYAGYPDAEEGSDDAHSNHTLFYHRLGTAQSTDTVVYQRPDKPHWLFFHELSEDGRTLFIHASEGGYQTLFRADLGDPMQPRVDAPVTHVLGNFDASYIAIGSDPGVMYVHSDHNAPRGAVVAVADDLSLRTLIPEQDDVLESVRIIGDHFVAFYLHDAYTRIRIYTLDGRFVRDVETPTFGMCASGWSRRADNDLYYLFASFLYPNRIFRLDLATGEHVPYGEPEMVIDESAYRTEQIWFTSRDGTRVPMFVTRRNDVPLDGTAPAMLYGYGGFGMPMTPMFIRWGLVWLEQGGVLAVANIRGGGEFGKEWHTGGILAKKQNSFDDFTAAAEHLIAKGYTSATRLVSHGGSNGGLLVSAVMCQRPELFAAVIPQVAVTDMLRYQHFTIGMAWSGDYGLSSDPDMLPVLLAYSPLHNLREGTQYPAVLVVTADHDDRVVPAHSFKFLARLQACQAGAEPVLLRITSDAGHGMGKPIQAVINESADILAFALHCATKHE